MSSQTSSTLPLTGTHLLGEVQTDQLDALVNLVGFGAYVTQTLARFGLQELGRVEHAFEEGCGFTLVVCLTESHISVHTWPELTYVTLDVYLCNYSRDNTRTCEEVFQALLDFFHPTVVQQRRMSR